VKTSAYFLLEGMSVIKTRKLERKVTYVTRKPNTKEPAMQTASSDCTDSAWKLPARMLFECPELFGPSDGHVCTVNKTIICGEELNEIC
jgi:hypothetical protein